MFFYCINFSIIIIFLNIFSLHFTENTVPIFCVEPEPEAEPEPSPGAGALIKSEAPKKAPDGPKMGGSGSGSGTLHSISIYLFLGLYDR